jgi:hypothetical protein
MILGGAFPNVSLDSKQRTPQSRTHRHLQCFLRRRRLLCSLHLLVQLLRVERSQQIEIAQKVFRHGHASSAIVEFPAILNQRRQSMPLAR